MTIDKWVEQEDHLCPECSGSGEGQYDGAVCWKCKGSGTRNSREGEE
jgi:DnaJ-class molecular chaperone